MIVILSHDNNTSTKFHSKSESVGKVKKIHVTSLEKRMYRILLITVFAFSFLFNLTAQTVYVTNTGKKYHTSNCSSLSSSKKSIELSEAINKGYTPCKKCNPDQSPKSNSNTNLLPDNNSQVKSQNDIKEQQCEAITKSGTRCKRKAQSGSKYCWQHKK